MPRRKPLPPRDAKRDLYAGLAVLSALSLFFQYSHWDLDLAAWFWSWPGGPWPGRDWGWSHALYACGEIPAYACGVLGFLVFLGSYHLESLRPWRGRGLFFALLLLLGPGLLVNVLGKSLTGRPRPSDLELFGGGWEFAKPWHFGVPGRGTSFPGGHASMAFYWLGLCFVLRSRGRRFLAFCSALGFGLLMSLARMAQGGHFLSDNLISGALVFTLAAALSPLLAWQPAPRFWARPRVLGALAAGLLGCLLLGQVSYEERSFLWARPGALPGKLPTERLQEWQPQGAMTGLALAFSLQRGDVTVAFSAKDDGLRLPLRIEERFNGLGSPGAKDRIVLSSFGGDHPAKLDGTTLGVDVEQRLSGLWWAVSAHYHLRLPQEQAIDARLKSSQGVLTIGHLPEGRQVLLNGTLRAQDLPIGFKPFGEHAWLRDGTQPQIALELSAPTIHFEP